MSSTNEVGRMVVRLLGETRQYQKSLKEAERITEDFAKSTDGKMREARSRFVSGEKVVQSELDKTRVQLLKAGLQVQMYGNAFSAVGDKVASVGRKMTLAVTAPIVGIAAASIKMGADMDAAFLGVQKTVNGTPAELQKVRSELEALGTTGGVAVDINELFGIAEVGGQLGIAREDIVSSTKTAADMGVATNLSSEEAGQALARISNITGMSKKKFDNLGSSIVALGNSTATSESEIVAMTLRLAGAGSQVGMVEHQITALAASLSSVGIEAEAGGTAFS